MKITRDTIKPKTVFHCSTEEQAEELCKKLYELGYKWASGKSYLGNTQHDYFGENTCYCPYHNAYDEINYCKIKKYKIIEYELDEYELEKANKRIVELEQAIKHLQGSNENKQNRIKNLESKLEEYKNIDDVMNLDVDEFLCYFQKLTKDVSNGIEEMLLGDNTIIIVAWLERAKKMLDQFLFN